MRLSSDSAGGRSGKPFARRLASSRYGLWRRFAKVRLPAESAERRRSRRLPHAANAALRAVNRRSERWRTAIAAGWDDSRARRACGGRHRGFSRASLLPHPDRRGLAGANPRSRIFTRSRAAEQEQRGPNTRLTSPVARSGPARPNVTVCGARRLDLTPVLQARWPAAAWRDSARLLYAFDMSPSHTSMNEWRHRRVARRYAHKRSAAGSAPAQPHRCRDARRASPTPRREGNRARAAGR
jgi:hypothetical protein